MPFLSAANQTKNNHKCPQAKKNSQAKQINLQLNDNYLNWHQIFIIHFIQYALKFTITCQIEVCISTSIYSWLAHIQ